jgi:hypothetical protein
MKETAPTDLGAVSLLASQLSFGRLSGESIEPAVAVAVLTSAVRFSLLQGQPTHDGFRWAVVGKESNDPVRHDGLIGITRCIVA